jgi:hypothetical protein
VIAAVVTEGRACEEGGMATDSRDRQRDAGEDSEQQDASTRPIHGVEFAVVRDSAGEATLDVINHPLEQTYRIGDTHGTKLFLALCRSRGLLPSSCFTTRPSITNRPSLRADGSE